MNFKQVLYILVNGKEGLEMDMESKSGWMGPSTQVNGEKTEHMAKENSFMLMETYTMAFGQMIKLMVMAYISM